MSSYTYEIIVRIDVGKAVNSVGELMKQLSAIASSYGKLGPMVLESETGVGTLAVNQELTAQQKEEISEIMRKQYSEAIPYLLGVELRDESSKSCSKSG